MCVREGGGGKEGKIRPYARFFLVHMCVREGGGGKEGKIRPYARFSYPVPDFVTHQ